MTNHCNHTHIPVHSRADVVIAGGTAGAVALALETKRRGLSVFLACSRPYLGTDLCGGMRLWPNEMAAPVSDLAKAVFPDPAKPSTPMHIKRTLEQSLVEAGVPFLLNTHFGGTIEPDGDLPQAAWFVTRSGLLAIETGQVIDKRQVTRPTGKQAVLHTTLCQGDGAEPAGDLEVEQLDGFSGTIGDAAYALTARRYRLEVDFGKGTPREIAKVASDIVGRCRVAEEYLHQENLLLESDRAQTDPVADMNAAGAGAAALEAPRWQPSGRDTIELDGSVIPDFDACDVLVLGGGTGGAPAGIAAGRTGADTIVLESTSVLGGVGTAGQIATYWCGNRVGFTAELDAGVSELEHDEKLRKSTSKWSISAKTEWYRMQSQQAGVTVLHRSIGAAVEVVDGRAHRLLTASPYGIGWIEAKCMVDATGCADIPAAAGAPVRTTSAEHVAVQGTGLAGLDPKRDYHNSDHNFCDDTDIADTTAFLVSSKLKFPDHFDAGQLIDSRERRQIVGEIELGPADFLAERRYPDTVSVSTSNFDSHGFTIHPLFMCKAPDKKRMWADVPFRAFLPQGVERVLATGLGMSAHRDALPVVRMQPDVQNHGYAAGYAAALSAQRDCDLRDLPIREIQKHLVEIGSLPDRVLEEEDSFPVSDEAIREAVEEGWDSYGGLALVFSNPGRAIPLLLERLDQDPPEAQALRYSLILALLGRDEGVALLQRNLSESNWDEGWNYRGMHQFGMSLSEIDVQLIALGRVGGPEAWPVILEKARALDANPDFSHCRAIAEACEGLYPRHPDAEAPAALAAILRQPGISGHHQADIHAVQSALTDDPEENAVRNRSLREIHLARALFRCGDPDGLGRSILEDYSRDLRAHFAKHCIAVLGEP